MDARLALKVTDLAQAPKLVAAALAADGCKIQSQTATQITAKRGSQLKMRTLGGAFVNLKVLPVQVQVDFTASSGAGEVRIWARDDLGFGVMLGMEAKYADAVNDLAAIVANAVNPIGDSTPAPKSDFCTKCGAKAQPDMSFCGKCGAAL